MAQGILPGFAVLEVQEEGAWYHVVYRKDMAEIIGPGSLLSG